MKKFMVLYMAASADFAKMMKISTPEQQKKAMDGWMKWMGKHKKSLVDEGAPLGKTKRVDAKGASNAKNGVGGYWASQIMPFQDIASYPGFVDFETAVYRQLNR